MIESFKLPNITPETLTGSIVSFNDEYGNLPLKSCTSLISGYQEGSGTASPDNVRPLHAFSSGTLTANSNTYTFTFGQSIYQGSIDWKRGVAVGTWGYIASYNGETLTGEWLCNKAPYEVGTTPPTGSQVAYELATPIEIPLGGIQLLTQQGVNNIFADCGDTEVQRLKVN